MAKRDYYQVLEVPRRASSEEIRKAFRKKALEYHPDRNKNHDAEERFKEVNEAYQALIDDEKRARYDRFGHAGVGPIGSADFTRDFEGFDIFGGFGDIFDSFFGDVTGRSQQRTAQRGNSLQQGVAISFEEAVFGTECEVEVTRIERCQRCHGVGSEPGTSPSRCNTCAGVGQVRRTQKNIFGQFTQVTSCPTCRGKGTVITSPCSKCHGVGTERRSRKIVTKIPPGIEDGAQIRLSGQGDVGINRGPPGNLYIRVSVKDHNLFRREGDDLIYELPINLVQATLGDLVEIPTLNGRESFRIPPGTQPGEVFRIKGKGVPHLNGSRRGDLVVPVNVQVPTSLNSQQRKLLEELGKTMDKPGEHSTKDKRLFDKLKDAFN